VAIALTSWCTASLAAAQPIQLVSPRIARPLRDGTVASEPGVMH
jgi:hypothetical protein